MLEKIVYRKNDIQIKIIRFFDSRICFILHGLVHKVTPPFLEGLHDALYQRKTYA